MSARKQTSAWHAPRRRSSEMDSSGDITSRQNASYTSTFQSSLHSLLPLRACHTSGTLTTARTKDHANRDERTGTRVHARRPPPPPRTRTRRPPRRRHRCCPRRRPPPPRTRSCARAPLQAPRRRCVRIRHVQPGAAMAVAAHARIRNVKPSHTSGRVDNNERTRWLASYHEACHYSPACFARSDDENDITVIT